MLAWKHAGRLGRFQEEEKKTNEEAREEEKSNEEARGSLRTCSLGSTRIVWNVFGRRRRRERKYSEARGSLRTCSFRSTRIGWRSVIWLCALANTRRVRREEKQALITQKHRLLLLLVEYNAACCTGVGSEQTELLIAKEKARR